jgi:hypothetical protein
LWFAKIGVSAVLAIIAVVFFMYFPKIDAANLDIALYGQTPGTLYLEAYGTPFVVTGLGADIRLQELLLVAHGEIESVPELPELRENAARLGGRLVHAPTSGTMVELCRSRCGIPSPGSQRDSPHPL